MKWFLVPVLVCGLVAGLCWAEGDSTKAGTGEKSDKDKEKDAKIVAAVEAYDKLVADYMKEKWTDVQAEVDKVCGQASLLNKQQRDDIIFIKKTAPEMRPAWWKYTRSSQAVSFQAKIWGKPIDANYMPTEELGIQAPVDIYRGKIRVVVSWKPSMVDSPKAADGELSKDHAFTKGDIAEAIVWHELGHNFITSAMSANDVMKLWRDFSMLYDHLQEFYADMTALYHAGPQARLITMMMRLDSLEENRDSESHTRAGNAIGSLILANMLMEPQKWPSVHFPGNVAAEDPERMAIMYVYEHIDPKWTLAEDRQLQKLIGDFIQAKGDAVFRSKGHVPLPNKLEFILMSTDDRDMQPKRDAWVKTQLEAVIKTGRADKPEPEAADPKGDKRHIFHHDGKRIEIPW